MPGESLLVSLARIAAVVAIGLPLVLYLLQDRLIFYPQPLAPRRRAEIARRYAAVEELFIEAADGTRLHAWHVKPAAAGAPLVLYFGGNAEEVSWMLEAIGDPVHGETPGVGWLLADYRGYGASAGRPSARALAGDALTLYDAALKLPGIDARRIFVFGRSLGSGFAVALVARRPLAGAILVAPFDSLAALAKHYYPYLPVKWLLRHRLDSLAAAPRMHAPLLCVIAQGDEVIPPAHAERLCAAWGGAKRVIVLPGARHNDTDAAPQFWPAVRAFLDARTEPAAAAGR
ncbi:MAG: alpha/beta hydrolase [Betaproteobacteria bacterium]|nr:alpha/beta hydrolase [Betaproteobacteria bacterium]